MKSIYKQSRNELLHLREEINARLALMETEQKEALKVELTELVAKHGWKIADLFGVGSAKKSKSAGKPRGKVPVKYMDTVSGKTWTGRGRMPNWIVNSGKSKESFEIIE